MSTYRLQYMVLRVVAVQEAGTRVRRYLQQVQTREVEGLGICITSCYDSEGCSIEHLDREFARCPSYLHSAKGPVSVVSVGGW